MNVPTGHGKQGDATGPGEEAPRVDLDVRPLLAEGGEPYRLIMDAVKGMAPGEVLRLRSPFDPTPLHRVLAGHGFVRITRERGPDDWETEYWRPEEAEPVVLDVRGGRPPEPLERTLAALEEIPDGRALVQVNDRVPAFLLPLLDERGYRYRIGEDSRGTLLTIWRPLPAA
jgi:uncharacterized protein (DUF2249 family)